MTTLIVALAGLASFVLPCATPFPALAARSDRRRACGGSAGAPRARAGTDLRRRGRHVRGRLDRGDDRLRAAARHVRSGYRPLRDRDQCALGSLEPASLADVEETIRTLGAATGKVSGSARCIRAMRERVGAISAAVAGRPRPRTLLLSSNLDQAAAMLAELERTRPSWSAFAGERAVVLVGGNRYVNRPGPSLAATVELFAAALHPGSVPTPPPNALRRCG